jgi:hypothetical protein
MVGRFKGGFVAGESIEKDTPLPCVTARHSVYMTAWQEFERLGATICIHMAAPTCFKKHSGKIIVLTKGLTNHSDPFCSRAESPCELSCVDHVVWIVM